MYLQHFCSIPITEAFWDYYGFLYSYHYDLAWAPRGEVFLWNILPLGKNPLYSLWIGTEGIWITLCVFSHLFRNQLKCSFLYVNMRVIKCIKLLRKVISSNTLCVLYCVPKKFLELSAFTSDELDENCFRCKLPSHRTSTTSPLERNLFSNLKNFYLYLFISRFI